MPILGPAWECLNRCTMLVNLYVRSACNQFALRHDLLIRYRPTWNCSVRVYSPHQEHQPLAVSSYLALVAEIHLASCHPHLSREMIFHAVNLIIQLAVKRHLTVFRRGNFTDD